MNELKTISDVSAGGKRFVCLQSETRQEFTINGKRVDGYEWKGRLKKAQKRSELLLDRLTNVAESRSSILLDRLEGSLKPP